VFSIGEFSKISGFSVKTLRFYHEKGVLVPSCVDDQTGYRYYDQANVEKARVVAQLRRMEFPLGQITEMLDCSDDEADLLGYLERQKEALQQRMQECGDIVRSLEHIISTEREAKMAVEHSTFEVEEKVLEPVLVAGVRFTGCYGDCGKYFAKIGRALGRHISGKPLNLYYDGEYREKDADIEACMPIRKRVEAEGISVRELPGGRCVSLVHQGPYDQLGRSYAKILDYVNQKGYNTILPSREVYLKGPGMIFKGNPKKYLTEIQIMIGGE
jgi:DNA-binding transcriptional MerR regulator/effector-binding domain-containing protein